MEKTNGFIDFFKRPNLVFTICLWVTGLVLLGVCIVAVVLELWHVQLRIAVIIVMTLVLLYALYATAMRLDLKTKALDFAHRHKHIAIVVDNYNVRTAFYACGSILIDLVYSIMDISLGYMHGTQWFKMYGFYYLALTVIRFCLIMWGARPLIKPTTRYARAIHEIRTYAVTGISLFMLNSVLYTMFDIMLVSGESFIKHYIIIYGTAIYTFYKIILAVNSFVKSRKSDNLVTKSMRNVSTISAFISLLIFQTSLLATFPEAKEPILANGITATFISLFTIILAITMIVSSIKQGRKLEWRKKHDPAWCNEEITPVKYEVQLSPMEVTDDTESALDTPAST